MERGAVTIWKLKICDDSIFHLRRSRQQHKHVSQHDREVLHEERVVGGGGVKTSTYLEMKNTKKFMTRDKSRKTQTQKLRKHKNAASLKEEERQMILNWNWSQGPKMRVARRSPGVAQYRWVATTGQNIKTKKFQRHHICSRRDGREKRPQQYGTTLSCHKEMVLIIFIISATTIVKKKLLQFSNTNKNSTRALLPSGPPSLSGWLTATMLDTPIRCVHSSTTLIASSSSIHHHYSML